MSWSFAFLAVVAVSFLLYIAHLHYIALQRHIDLVVEQLSRDVVARIENLKQRQGEVTGSEVLQVVKSATGQLRNDLLAEIEALKRERDATATQREQPKDKHDELIRERVSRNLSDWAVRYAAQDAYTISELTRSYDREDSRGRIHLLRRVYAQTCRPPDELTLKAVTDSDPAVREWMARKAQLLFSGLTERLRQDSDPFVRAALFENPEFLSSLWIEPWLDEFKTCTPLGRLAMMRNEALNLDLVELILDLNDTKLGIEMSERFQLAKACLVNKRVVENGRRTRTRDFPYYLSRDHSKAVWELAAKWPEDHGIQIPAFYTVQTYDRVKAAIYPKCQDSHLREAILQSCLPEDEETLKLGRADTDPMLRSMAYWRSRRMDRQAIEDALRREKGEKDNGMDGIFTNPWLEPTARELLDAMVETKDNPSQSDSPVPS
jgi:hypothetical protein